MAVAAPGVWRARGAAGWRRILLRSEPLRGYALLSPTLVVMIVGLGFAVVLLLAFSFWSQDYLTVVREFTSVNYEAFVSKRLYSALLFRSIGISALVTLVTVVLAYPCAYFIAFHVKRRKLVWLALITAPFLTSYLLRVFAWKIILGYEGVINSALLSVGLIDEPLGFLLYSRTAVILTLAHAWAAFALLPIYVSLEKIDRTLLEAATDLGDGPVARFLRVTLPLSMPGVISAGLLVFIPTVGDYVTPSLVGGTEGLMIGNLIQSQFGKANNWPLGAALSVASMVVVTFLVCAFLGLSRVAQRRLIA
ncbi:MAG TPA: ABC transporter permease [Alphaproteobacteria bacterium]|nr:ABC transporter permease [Alphaproteobacteria bacterium]